MQNITYGIGGYCVDCNDTHQHPLHNIIEIVEVENAQPETDHRSSAIAKLEAVGLTQDEISALLGAS
mgnify:CR=1 FL=1